MIHNVNSELSSFNSALSALINTQLNLRLQKAEDYLTLRQKLNIPMELYSISLIFLISKQITLITFIMKYFLLKSILHLLL